MIRILYLRELLEDVKTQKCSTSDPESGWFRKGEHKHVFAYAVETACDKHGWILGYTVHPGNEHDSRTFKSLYDKISKLNPQMMVADAGYKTPAIAHQLLEDGIQPLFPYTRPKTKEGFFGKHEFAYDEYYDCYICPGAHILPYSTTNRSGYKEYKSCGEHCAGCQYLSKCTESKDHIKLITRHVWEKYMEVAEDIRHTIGNRQIYQLRKETIETDIRYSERTTWISIYAVCRKGTDGNESRAYLRMHESEKTGKDPGKTRLEYRQVFVDFEKNKKKRSFKRKMVLGITPNTKFVYSLSTSDEVLFSYYKSPGSRMFTGFAGLL